MNKLTSEVQIHPFQAILTNGFFGIDLKSLVTIYVYFI